MNNNVMKYTSIKKIKNSKLYKELEKLTDDISLHKQGKEYYCEVNLYTEKFGINYMLSFYFSEENFVQYVNNFDIEGEAIFLKTNNCGYPKEYTLIDTIYDIENFKNKLINITKKL